MTIKTRNELLEGILSEVSGTGAGAAVLSVSGDIVSNADPLNPVVTFPVDITTMLNTRAQLGNTVATDGIITPIVLVGTGDVQLPPPALPQPTTGGVYNGYVELTGLSIISESGAVTVVGSEIIIGASGAGDYRTPHAWLDVSTDSNNNVVGFVFAIEKLSTGLLSFSQRVTGNRSAAHDQQTNIAGGGFVSSLVAGDKISVWAAASVSCNLTVYDANLGLEMAIPASFKV
jgi:hypothetical protein